MAVGARGWPLVPAILAALLSVPVLRAERQAIDPEVQIQLGDLLLREGRYADAAEAYRKARDLGDARDRVRAGRGLVRALLRTAEFRRARGEGAALVALAPDNAEAQALNGDALWAAGLFDEAEDAFTRAAAADPREARAHNGLAKSRAARNQLDSALESALLAVSHAPSEADFRHTLGYVYERLRRYEDAAVSFDDFLNLLSGRDRSERAIWTHQQIRFLRSFGTRVPLEMTPAVAQAVHTIPFRLVRDKIVVGGKINGGRTIDLVLDTGAELTTVTQRTAERARIEPVVYTLSAGVGQIGLRGLQVGRIDELKIGTLVVRNVPALLKNPPLRNLPTHEADSFSPLAFGLSLTVDYSKRLLTISQTLPAHPGEMRLPLRMHRLALVRGLVNDRNSVHFVVDTGGEVISISRATFDAIDAEPPRRIPLKVYGTSGWDPDAFLMPGLDLAFDRVRLPKQAVVVLNLDAPSALLGFEVGGIVGHRFLSKYRVAIDLARSELRLGAL
jgi:Flp pilus assembly protein TadD